MMLSITFGSRPYWKPGMRGVPFRIISRTTASLPVTVSMLSIGPYVLVLSGGGKWQIEHRCSNILLPIDSASLIFEGVWAYKEEESSMLVKIAPKMVTFILPDS